MPSSLLYETHMVKVSRPVLLGARHLGGAAAGWG